MKKILRKLHLWLSVPFGIFITLICFSGSMLVFEQEITESVRRDCYFVRQVGGEPLPLDTLLNRVAATLPDSVSVTGITLPADPARTCQVSLSKPRRTALFVDRYTGEVKGRSGRLPFYDTMFRLHRWMLGSADGDGGIAWGKLLVGVSTLMLVVILITGILMWLTNRNKPLAKSLKISFTKGWPRFWHDLHVAGGIYATLFLLALALTGLTWSFPWYRTGFYKTFGVEAAAGHGARGGENRGEARGGENRGGENRGSENRGGGARNHAEAARPARERRPETAPEGNDSVRESRPAPYAHWQEVYESLVRDHPDYRQITIASGAASIVPAGRKSLRAGDRFDFDTRSGAITGKTPYADQKRDTKVRGAVYTVHVGSWGGLLTRILTFLAALLGATLPLTGYYLWIRRLVKGRPHHGPQAVPTRKS